MTSAAATPAGSAHGAEASGVPVTQPLVVSTSSRTRSAPTGKVTALTVPSATESQKSRTAAGAAGSRSSSVSTSRLALVLPVLAMVSLTWAFCVGTPGIGSARVLGWMDLLITAPLAAGPVCTPAEQTSLAKPAPAVAAGLEAVGQRLAVRDAVAALHGEPEEDPLGRVQLAEHPHAHAGGGGEERGVGAVVGHPGAAAARVVDLERGGRGARVLGDRRGEEAHQVEGVVGRARGAGAVDGRVGDHRVDQRHVAVVGQGQVEVDRLVRRAAWTGCGS